MKTKRSSMIEAQCIYNRSQQKVIFKNFNLYLKIKQKPQFFLKLIFHRNQSKYWQSSLPKFNQSLKNRKFYVELLIYHHHFLTKVWRITFFPKIWIWIIRQWKFSNFIVLWTYHFIYQNCNVFHSKHNINKHIKGGLKLLDLLSLDKY